MWPAFLGFLAMFVAAPQARPSSELMIVASQVRLRTAPATSANEIDRLSLGTIVSEIEKSQDQHWYRVTVPSGKTGWIFGTLTIPIREDDRMPTYRRVVSSRLAMKDAGFSDRTELVEFLDRAIHDATGIARAELELLRLRALHFSIQPIYGYIPNNPTHQKWITQHERELGYSEPAGAWLVKADLYWELAEKHRAYPIADEIAWEGANTALPGECEGFLDCYMWGLRVTVGRYLELYPRGAHINEALDRIDDLQLEALKAENVFEVDQRPSLRSSIDALISIVQRTNSARSVEIIERLRSVIQRYA